MTVQGFKSLKCICMIKVNDTDTRITFFHTQKMNHNDTPSTKDALCMHAMQPSRLGTSGDNLLSKMHSYPLKVTGVGILGMKGN